MLKIYKYSKLFSVAYCVITLTTLNQHNYFWSYNGHILNDRIIISANYVLNLDEPPNSWIYNFDAIPIKLKDVGLKTIHYCQLWMWMQNCRCYCANKTRRRAPKNILKEIVMRKKTGILQNAVCRTAVIIVSVYDIRREIHDTQYNEKIANTYGM